MMINKKATRAIAAVAICMAASFAAQAHVSLDKGETRVGGGYKAVFKVPHGCEGSATIEVSIDIPEGVIAVKPMPKPGWTIELQRGPYARSYAFYHGKSFDKGVRKVTWRGGPLPDEYFDEFTLSTFVAGELTPGAKLTFPVTQRCEKGEITWTQVAKDGEDAHALDFPAPQLLLVAGDDHAHHAKHVSNDLRAGDLLLAAPWTRATPKGATAAAGYLKINNTGDAADTLLGASSDVAERVELHETSISAEGVSSMRPLADGLTIAPGQSVELKPLGAHIMLIGLKAPLEAGQSANVRLRFERAGTVNVPFDVKPIGGKGAHAHVH